MTRRFNQIRGGQTWRKQGLIFSARPDSSAKNARRRPPLAFPDSRLGGNHGDLSCAADPAGALGRLGRNDARPMLLQLLQQAPSAAVIDAISAIADEECLVILGRIARTRPDLVDAALDGRYVYWPNRRRAGHSRVTANSAWERSEHRRCAGFLGLHQQHVYGQVSMAEKRVGPRR